MPILGIMASQISGKLWAPAGAYDALATITVGATAVSSVTFVGIPSGYKHLQIRAINSNATEGNIFMQYNGDTGANYNRHYFYGDGASVAAGSDSSTQSGGFTSTTSGQFGAQVIDILDYADTNKYKTSRMLTGFDNNGSGFIVFYSGLWRNTAAVNQVTLVTNAGHTFRQYSSFALYGIR